jgi:hypothetical protein
MVENVGMSRRIVLTGPVVVRETEEGGVRNI